MCEAIPSPDLVFHAHNARRHSDLISKYVRLGIVRVIVVNFNLIHISLTDPPAAISELYNNI